MFSPVTLTVSALYDITGGRGGLLFYWETLIICRRLDVNWELFALIEFLSVAAANVGHRLVKACH